MTNEFEQENQAEFLSESAESQTQDLGAEKAEFFADSDFGKVKVEAPDSNEAMFFQAANTAEKEQIVREELDQSDESIENKVEASRQAMQETRSAFSEAKNIQEMVDELSREGKIFKALDFDVKADSEIPNEGLHFVVTPESVISIKESARKNGYNVREIKGKGVVVETPFGKYTFITGKNLDQKALESGEKIEDDYDDEEDGEDEFGSKTKNRVKKKITSASKKTSRLKAQKNLSGSKSDSKKTRSKVSPGQKVSTDQMADALFDLPPLSSPISGSQSTPNLTPEIKSGGHQTPSSTGLESGSAPTPTSAPAAPAGPGVSVG